MLIEQTLTMLQSLKLTGMAAALAEQRGLPDLASLPFEDRLALLLERELGTRQDRRLTRLIQLARFRHAACVEDVNFVRSAASNAGPSFSSRAGSGSASGKRC